MTRRWGWGGSQLTHRESGDQLTHKERRGSTWCQVGVCQHTQVEGGGILFSEGKGSTPREKRERVQSEMNILVCKPPRVREFIPQGLIGLSPE